MKFDYKIPDQKFKMYGEANYVFMNQQKFLNGVLKKIKNFYYEPIALVIILFILNIVLRIINAPIKDVVNVIFVLSIIYLFTLFISYFNYITNLKEGVIKVDKKGITDITNIYVTFPWETIKLIGMTNNMMVILSENSQIMLLLEPQEQLLEEILKYKDIKVIRN